MKEKAYKTASGNIHYWINIIDDDAITLVFLPGLTLTHRLFDIQIEYFKGKYNVFAWDAPGHGASWPFEFNFDMMGKARWLNEILEQEKISKPVMEQKFLFFDTETTDVQSKDIIQLAFLTSDGKEFNEYFKPEQDISFGAMAVHHITPEFLEDKPMFKERMVQDTTSMTLFSEVTLKEYLNNLGKEYIWVAHNVEFDMEVLKKKGIEIPKYICTLKVARNMLEDENKRDLESYSLQYLRYYLGLYKKEKDTEILPHDAMGDVIVLKNLFDYLQHNSVLTPENRMTISKEPQYIRTLTFGKYAGYNLEDVVKTDREYLEWLMENAQDKKDLLYNIDRVLNSF